MRKVTIEQKPNGFLVTNGDGEVAFFKTMPEALVLVVRELKAESAFARASDDVTLTIEPNTNAVGVESSNVRQISSK